MQQSQRAGENVNQYLTGSGCLFSACLKLGLCKLDIPVAEYVPDKVVDLGAALEKLPVTVTLMV